MKLLSASDVCECLSTQEKRFPYQTLNTWIKRRVISPVRDAEGTGHHRVFSLIDVLAIAAGHGLRSNGYSDAVARKVTATVKAMTEEELLASFAKRKNCLMIVANEVCPVMMTKTAILNNDENIDYAAAEQYGLAPSALDVKRLYDNIVTRIDAIAAKRKTTKA